MNALRNKKILVTGASGLMGSTLLQRLKAAPDISVRAVFYNHPICIEGKNITPFKADLTDAEVCRNLTEGIDFLFMFAAKIDRHNTGSRPVLETLSMNVNMLEAAYRSGIRKVLWLSSAMAYPATDGLITEETMFMADPPANYFGMGWMTRYIEKLCQAYSQNSHRPMTTLVLRPSAIYGPFDNFNPASCHVFPALIRQVAERQDSLEIWGTGEETRRDFIFADDVVDACLLALDRLDEYDCLNIGSGHVHTVKDIVEVLMKKAGYKPAVVYNDKRFVKPSSVHLDCKKASERINFKTKTSLEEGVDRTIHWFRENSMNSGNRIRRV